MRDIEGSRGKIVYILQRKKGGTVEGLAKELGLASPTVRRHLDVLQRDGLIRFREVHRLKGRPHYLYFLTPQGEEGLPRDYGSLARWILRAAASLLPGEADNLDGPALVGLLCHKAAQQLSLFWKPRFDGKNLAERVTEMGRILQQEGFLAEWEQENGNYRLVAYNCPYYRVAKAYNQVCNLDMVVFSQVFPGGVEREKSLARGDDCCSYLVTPERT